MNIFLRFLDDESGATAIEYGLIAAFVSIAIITVLKLVGSNLTAVFSRVASELGKAASQV